MLVKYKFIRKRRKAVSPIIAVVLLIALTVAAGAVIYTVVNNLMGDQVSTLIIDDSTVSDANSNNVGDTIGLFVRNLGQSPVTVDTLVITRDGVTLSSWTLVKNEYVINGTQVALVFAQTLNTADEINANHVVKVKLRESNGGPISKEYQIIVPSKLSAIPEIFAKSDFTNFDFTGQGWTTHTYHTHGGSGNVCADTDGDGIRDPICVDNGDILFNTNDDVLFYLNNTVYKAQNGVITFDFYNGDNDAMGITFRMEDEDSYYWVGYTNDHNGPNNRAGESEATFPGPFFTYNQRVELHKLVNGVDTILANATAPFTIASGSQSNKQGPYTFQVSFYGDSIAVQVSNSGTAGLTELFSITDSTFAASGYFGVFSLASMYSTMDSFSVTA